MFLHLLIVGTNIYHRERERGDLVTEVLNRGTLEKRDISTHTREAETAECVARIDETLHLYL